MSRFDRLSLLLVTAVAALLRLPGIDARGAFDADQGHDMRTLVAFTRDGLVPLLGPKTSVGEFHHGAFYYFLLAPAAAISNGDPVAVTAFIALLGIGAVVLTWWLARAMAGPLAGALAGLLLAVSPAAISESTFIWNPNPIAFFAVLSLAAAWRARTPGARRTRLLWAVAIGSAGAVTQLHVLGVVFLFAVLGLALLELRRDRGVALGIGGGFGIVVVVFLPLIVHELQTGFQETGYVLDYLRSGDPAPTGGPVAALAFTLLRIVGWPLVGLVTDVPALVAVLLAVVVGLVAVGLLRTRGSQRTALAWLVGMLAWSAVALAFAAPSLQRVVPGLPNDHYHAFVDPIVILLIAIPAAGLLETAMAAWRSSRRTIGAALAGVIAAGVVALMVTGLLRMPPAADPDGGWPALRAAGERIAKVVGGGPVTLVGLPDFKLPDAVGFPIEVAGVAMVASSGSTGRYTIVACDRLFESVMHQPCGGPAETVLVPGSSSLVLIDRFPASPRTVISIYDNPAP